MELVAELAKVKSGWENDSHNPFRLLEAIFVVDAAIDDSEVLLSQLKDKHDWVRVVTLSRNFGQHPATIAGILHTSGDWIITLDEDLQHNPMYFIDLLAQMARSSDDIIYECPAAAVHQSAWRDLASRGFKAFMSWATDNPHIRLFNSFRLIRGPVARAAASACSHETYLDIAMSWFTKRVSSIILNLQDQRFISTGNSGYSLGRLLSHARRMIVSSRARVLRFVIVVGLFSVLVSSASGLYYSILRVVAPASIPVRGWTSLFVVITFLGGMLLLLLSIALEYLTTILLHVQGKPAFFIVDRSLDKIARRYFESGLSS